MSSKERTTMSRGKALAIVGGAGLALAATGGLLFHSCAENAARSEQLNGGDEKSSKTFAIGNYVDGTTVEVDLNVFEELLKDPKTGSLHQTIDSRQLKYAILAYLVPFTNIESPTILAQIYGFAQAHEQELKNTHRKQFNQTNPPPQNLKYQYFPIPVLAAVKKNISKSVPSKDELNEASFQLSHDFWYGVIQAQNALLSRPLPKLELDPYVTDLLRTKLPVKLVKISPRVFSQSHLPS